MLISKRVAVIAGVVAVVSSVAGYALANTVRDPWNDRYEPTKLEWLVMAPASMSRNKVKLFTAGVLSGVQLQSSSLNLTAPKTTVTVTRTELREGALVHCDFSSEPTALKYLGNHWESVFDRVCRIDWTKSK